MSEPIAGSLLGHYRIESELGRGGMGVVFRAVDVELDRPVALKVIGAHSADEPGFRERFARESRLAASIDHPNIVPVYEAGEDGGHVFLAMRLVDGEDLARVIAREHGLDPPRAVRIVRQVAAALDAAHRVGLVHRDVKPANVLLVGTGEEEHAYLTDFGLARTDRHSRLTATGILVGTPSYMAPEQVNGERAGPSADVYALGCLLFEALTGRPPFEAASDVAVMLAHLQQRPPAPSTVRPDLPAALDAVLETALAKDPAARHASTTALARDAQAALDATVAPDAVATATAPGARDALVSQDAMAIVTAPTTRTRDGPTARAAAPRPAPSRATSRSPRGRLARWIAPPVLLAGVAAVLLILIVDGDEPPGDGVDQLSVSKVVDVDGFPDGLIVDGNDVFVADQRGRLVRIDARTAKVTDKIRLKGSPDSVAGEKGILWVSLQRRNAVARVDVRGDEPLVLKTIRVGRAPESLTLSPQVLWVANRGASTVTRIDRVTTSVLTPPISGIGEGPIGIFAGPSVVWVAGSRSGTVARIDAKTAELIGTPVKVGSDARDVVEGAGGVWVALPLQDAVVRLNPRTGRQVGEPIPVGQEPTHMTVGGGSVWVTNFGDGTVSRIDPKTNRTVGTAVVVGDKPIGIAFARNSVWVANGGQGTVAQIRVPLAEIRPR